MTQNNEQNEQPEPEVTQDHELLMDIESVQYNAFNPAFDNCISVDLTYQQAFSIVLRSRQLEQEGTIHSYDPNKKEMTRQIEKCYRQQFRR